LGPPGTQPHSHSEANRPSFDFLGEHPRIRHELEANPNLVNNPAYLRDHPQFIDFFRNHDEVRRELERNAPEIMHREEIDMAQRHKPE
jgi:hypothetical protein